MSEIGELVYTLLLGWMRGLVDWFWSMFSGRGNTGAWQWFLSNWKLWLAVLLVGGLVVDLVMWVVRWRPYRVLLSRLRRTPRAQAPVAVPAAEPWDDGAGFYAPEMASDSEAGQWGDVTFATLSEVDPDWANTFSMDPVDDPLYDPDYDPALAGGQADDTPPAPEILSLEEDVAFEAAGDLALVQAEEAPFPAEETDIHTPQAGGFDPYAPYDAYAPEEVVMYETDDTRPGTGAQPAQDDEPMLYGRPGLWPGMQYPFAAAQEDAPQEAEDAPVKRGGEQRYDPLFNPGAPIPEETTPPRRRRRRLHERADAWQPEDPIVPAAPEGVPDWMQRPAEDAAPRTHRRRRLGMQPAPVAPPEPDPALQETRPSRVVRPEDFLPPDPEPGRGGRKKKRQQVRTVTGKPAKPRGLRRFASMEEDPIAGLPPLDLTNPFLPPVRPKK